MSESNERAITVGVLGSSESGKSGLVNAWAFQKFSPGYDPTLEDTFERSLGLSDSRYNMQVNDYGGNMNIWEEVEVSVAGCQAFIIAFSLSSRDSYALIDTWLDRIVKAQATRGIPREKIPIILVATKVDLPRVVTPAECEGVRIRLKAPFVETSAKEFIKVDEPFLLAIQTWRETWGLQTDGLCRGYLTKEAGTLKSKQKRWFKLDGNILKYYKDDGCDKRNDAPLAQINLQGACLQPPEKPESRVLRLDGPALNAKKGDKRAYSFIAQNEPDYIMWRTFINTEIARMS